MNVVLRFIHVVFVSQPSPVQRRELDGDSNICCRSTGRKKRCVSNLLATLTYLETFLVIVCGHTGCGAITASFRASKTVIPGRTPITLDVYSADSPLNRFLAPLTTSIANLVPNLQISSVVEAEAIPVLIRENVKVQVDNLCETEVIQNAWRTRPVREELTVYGWLYDIGTGRIQDMEISRGPESLPKPRVFSTEKIML